VEKVKAIVAEIDKEQMIVITAEGDFIKVKRQMKAAIGDEIELKPQKAYLIYKGLARVAACFLACIFLSTGVYAYFTPYSYVSVDINPSISISLNRFERVLSVNPLTEDAVSIINNTRNLKNQDIDRALSEIIKSASDEGYIDQETENQIVVVVSTKDPKQEKKLEDTVTAATEKELLKVNKNSGVMVEKTSVASYKTALSNKTSPGKEMLSGKLKEVNPEIKDEEVKKMSVKEVMNMIKEGREAAKKEEKDKKGRDKDKNQEEDALKDKGKDKEEGKGKEENTQKAGGRTGYGTEEAEKAEEKDKSNNRNDEKKNSGVGASKKIDENGHKSDKRTELGEKEKEEKDKKDNYSGEDSKNENKTYNHRTWGKKNANEVKDREKNNSNLKINTKDNKKWLGR